MEHYIDYNALTGNGFINGWYQNCNCRYRCFKGGRNTKKSMVIGGFEILHKIITNPLRNVLCVRQTYSTHRDSTFATLKMLINQPDLTRPYISFSKYFKCTENPLQITYLPTGQKIFFRGCDDTQKIQSIRPTTGFLTDVYVEEAFEVKSYEQFRKIDGSVRGLLPEGLFFQITFLMNAWDVGHWIYDKFWKDRFEDNFAFLDTHRFQDYRDDNYVGDYGKGLYLHTSTYKINEFRDVENYDAAMLNMKLNSLELYKVEALGMWGNTTEAVYPERSDKLVISRERVMNTAFSRYAIGIDTGLSNGEGKVKHGEDVKIRSATTMQLVGLTSDYSTLVAIDEYFWSNEQQNEKKTEPQIMREILQQILKWRDVIYRYHYYLFKGTILVYVDCADKGFREGLAYLCNEMGLYNIQFMGSTKHKILTRIDYMRTIMSRCEYLVSEDCKNLIREIKGCKRGKKGEPREDVNDHCINANEYAWASLWTYQKIYNDFKQR